jgi:hypothetical protein
MKGGGGCELKGINVVPVGRSESGFFQRSRWVLGHWGHGQYFVRCRCLQRNTNIQVTICHHPSIWLIFFLVLQSQLLPFVCQVLVGLFLPLAIKNSELCNVVNGRYWCQLGQYWSLHNVISDQFLFGKVSNRLSRVLNESYRRNCLQGPEANSLVILPTRKKSEVLWRKADLGSPPSMQS